MKWKFRPSILLLTNHKTSSQSKINTVGKEVQKIKIAIVLAYDGRPETWSLLKILLATHKTWFLTITRIGCFCGGISHFSWKLMSSSPDGFTNSPNPKLLILKSKKHYNTFPFFTSKTRKSFCALWAAFDARLKAGCLPLAYEKIPYWLWSGPAEPGGPGGTCDSNPPPVLGWATICFFLQYLQGNPEDKYMVSLQSVKKNRVVSLDFLQSFSIDIAEKTYGETISLCKHLQWVQPH